GDILATESADGRDGERGILREVKMPGAHRLNPYAYSWDEVSAVEVADHQIGVRTLKVGKDPRTLSTVARRSAYVVPAGYRTLQAKDFILTGSAEGNQRVQNNREKLQRAMVEKVQPLCRKLGIDVRAVTLADLVPPSELAEQISMRELARVEQDKNKVRLRQYKSEQLLKGAETLKQRAQETVKAETRLIQAKT